MGTKPWKMREGFLIGGGLLVLAVLLQATIGPVRWDLMARPVNLLLLIGFLVLIGVMYALRRKVYLFEWMMQLEAVVPALCYALGLTILLGLVAQQEEGGGIPWLSQMLDFWPFVLAYAWLMILCGLVALKHMMRFSLKEIPFLLNHVGLFMALVCGALGAPDIQRVHMTTREGETECRAEDGKGNVHELDVSIELHDFIMEEFPMQPGAKMRVPSVSLRMSLFIRSPATLFKRSSRSISLCRWPVGRFINTIMIRRRAWRARSVSSKWSATRGNRLS